MTSKTARIPHFKRDYIETIEDIFNIAGGEQDLAAALDVHQVTAEGWRKYGIPIKYWEKIYSLWGITPGELYSITQKCRNRVNSYGRKR